MIFYIAILLVLLVGILWLVQLVMTHPGTATITWGIWSVEMKTATLVLLVVAACLAFYLVINLFSATFGLRKNLNRQRARAQRSLNLGLIQLTEGHWDKAEKSLTETVAYSDNKLLNYLAAARAAHMQEAYERRDGWLKRAIESDSQANIAVGVSQADMQLASGQLEQAGATLTRLRDLAPKHPYVLKLLARVLYKQENWDQLLELLPDLVKFNLLKTDSMTKVQAATLQAMFQKHAKAKQTDKLQAMWKKLPQVVRENSQAVVLYARALQTAGDDVNAATLVSSQLNKQWNNELADLYGNIRHHSLGNAIQQAEKWLALQPSNPVIQLILARLYNQQKLWGMAKSYYESSLNQAPNASAYLELAELLETMKEPENAQRCYRLGLRYSIRGEGERLVLTPTQRPQLPQTPVLTPYNGL